MKKKKVPFINYHEAMKQNINPSILSAFDDIFVFSEGNNKIFDSFSSEGINLNFDRRYDYFFKYLMRKKRKSIKFDPVDHTKIFYNRKLIRSGNVIEYYNFPCSFQKGGTKSDYISVGKVSFEKIISSEEGKSSSRRRSKREFIRLVNCNQHHFTKFLTLTFDPSIFPDCQDISLSNKYFTNFIKRLKRLCLDRFGSDFSLKYIAGLEFQPISKNIHYHILFNVPFLEDRKHLLRAEERKYIINRYGVEEGFLTACWGAGAVKINKIDVLTANNLGAYCGKYMCKEFENSSLYGKKLYFRSRDLEKPLQYFNDEADSIFEEYKDYVVSTQDIETNYITFSRVMINLNKNNKEIVHSEIVNDYFNLTDFIFEFESCKFFSNYHKKLYSLNELYEEGIISEDKFFHFAGLLQNFKREQLEFY